MMRALAAAGRRAEALVLFERLRTVLQQELARSPKPANPPAVPGTAGEAAHRTPVGPPPQPPRATNLPVRVAALVGRRRELEETAESSPTRGC